MASARKAARAKDRHEMNLLAIPGVQGVGVGEAEAEVAIKVYVERDTPDLRERIPRELEGVPVAVEVTGEFRAQ